MTASACLLTMLAGCATPSSPETVRVPADIRTCAAKEGVDIPNEALGRRAVADLIGKISAYAIEQNRCLKRLIALVDASK